MAFEPSDQQDPPQSFLRQTSQPLSNPDSQTSTHSLDSPESSKRTHCEPTHARPLDDRLISQIRKWSRFCALAIQIDLPDTDDAPQGLNADLDAVLASTARHYKATWFRWDGPLFGCVLPKTTPEKALKAASALQQELALKREETVTIGVAQYPLLSFSRSQTLINACKAVNHAAFFGPGGTAVFDSVSLNISADRYYQTGHMETAIAEYQDALRLDPHDLNVHNSLGVCLAELKDYPAARECFRSALALSPNEPMATYNLGAIHLLLKENQQALALLKKAYAQNTKNFHIPYQIGRVLVEQGHIDKAKPYLDDAVSLRPDSGACFGLIGQCLAKEKKIPEAIKAFKKAVKLNPYDATALSVLGRLYDQKGENPDICLTFSRQSVALSPRNGEFRFRLAQLYQKHGYFDLAMTEFGHAVNLGYDCQRQIDDLNAKLEVNDAPSSRCA